MFKTKFYHTGQHAVGAYGLNGCTGTIDLSGGGHDASIVGNPTYVNGPIGDQNGAISLNENSYVTIFSNGSLNTRYSISISMHVYVTGEGYIVNYGNTEGLGLSYFAGKLKFQPREYNQEPNGEDILEAEMTTDAWHFVVATYDFHSLTSTLYIDGFMAASAQLAQSRELATNEDALLFGGEGFGFVGDLACVQIFDRVLTGIELIAVALCPQRKWACCVCI